MVAKHLRRIMGHPVHSFIHHGPKARLVQMAGALVQKAASEEGLGSRDVCLKGPRTSMCT